MDMFHISYRATRTYKTHSYAITRHTICHPYKLPSVTVRCDDKIIRLQYIATILHEVIRASVVISQGWKPDRIPVSKITKWNTVVSYATTTQTLMLNFGKKPPPINGMPHILELSLYRWWYTVKLPLHEQVLSGHCQLPCCIFLYLPSRKWRRYFVS